MDDGIDTETAFASLTPLEFERFVVAALREQGVGLSDFRVTHLEPVAGVDGTYAMDAVARFTALGADFTVLIECKHQRRRVERDVIQVLVDKLRSTSSHKGMVFSSGGFQRGALEYAKKHGVALVKVVDGRSLYQTRSVAPTRFYPPGLPRYAGWLLEWTVSGHRGSLLGEIDSERFEQVFLSGTQDG
jgi:restriction system protein